MLSIIGSEDEDEDEDDGSDLFALDGPWTPCPYFAYKALQNTDTLHINTDTLHIFRII